MNVLVMASYFDIRIAVLGLSRVESTFISYLYFPGSFTGTLVITWSESDVLSSEEVNVQKH